MQVEVKTVAIIRNCTDSEMRDKIKQYRYLKIKSFVEFCNMRVE